MLPLSASTRLLWTFNDWDADLGFDSSFKLRTSNDYRRALPLTIDVPHTSICLF